MATVNTLLMNSLNEAPFDPNSEYSLAIFRFILKYLSSPNSQKDYRTVVESIMTHPLYGDMPQGLSIVETSVLKWIENRWSDNKSQADPIFYIQARSKADIFNEIFPTSNEQEAFQNVLLGYGMTVVDGLNIPQGEIDQTPTDNRHKQEASDKMAKDIKLEDKVTLSPDSLDDTLERRILIRLLERLGVKAPDGISLEKIIEKMTTGGSPDRPRVAMVFDCIRTFVNQNEKLSFGDILSVISHQEKSKLLSTLFPTQWDGAAFGWVFSSVTRELADNVPQTQAESPWGRLVAAVRAFHDHKYQSFLVKPAFVLDDYLTIDQAKEIISAEQQSVSNTSPTDSLGLFGANGSLFGDVFWDMRNAVTTGYIKPAF